MHPSEIRPAPLAHADACSVASELPGDRRAVYARGADLLGAYTTRARAPYERERDLATDPAHSGVVELMVLCCQE